MKKTNNPVMVLSGGQPPCQTVCAKTYSKMLSQRESRPLNYGLYKLKEALRFVEALESEIQLLSNLLKKGEQLRGLRTYGDHAQWIKNVPKFIAEEFGWKVLPAIKALGADGVDAATLEKQLVHLERRINHLILECDIAFEKLKAPISQEYSRWKMGHSALDDLFYLSKSIIQASINLTFHTRSMGLAQIAETKTEQEPN